MNIKSYINTMDRKYIKLFDTNAEYETYITSQDRILPNVSYCINKDETHYIPYFDTLTAIFKVTDNGQSVLILNNPTLFSEIEIDGIVQANVVTTYTFDTKGLHTVKYTLNDDTSITNSAFTNCAAMVSLFIPNSVVTITNGAFSNCKGLSKLVFSNGLTTISSSAFPGCTSLTKFVLPDTITRIENGAFSSCYNLMTITIPSGVTTITGNPFSGCYFKSNNFINNSSLDEVTNNYWGATIIDSDTDGFLIKDNSLLKYRGKSSTVTIPNSVTSIGNYAFQGCSDTTSITIPNSVTSISIGAFYGCSSLTSLTIPNSVTTISANIFSTCTGLTSITVNSGNTKYDSRNNCNAIIETATNKLIAGCKNTVIPNTVTEIANYAFYYCRSLTSITIPSGVTSMGNNAFSGCTGLTTVTLNSNSIVSATYSSSSNFKSIFGAQVTEYIIGNGVTSIGNYAFYNCTGLTSVTIGSGVTSIGNNAFNGCSGLTKVIISDIAVWFGISFSDYYSNPISYAKHIYSDENTEITTLVIPNSVTSINGYVFYNCSSLTSVTIPNTVTSIGDLAFVSCTGLTGTLTIPDSVTSIGNNAFRSCTSLTSVTIGSGVTSIGNNAFTYCSSLTSVTIQATTPPTLSSYSAFGNNYPIYVPSASVNAYKSATQWSNLASRIQAIPTA